MSREKQTHYLPVEALGMTEEALEAIEVGTSTKGWKHFTPDFVDTHQQEFNLDTTMEVIKDRAILYEQSRIEQPEANIVIPTGLPISVVFFGDWHIGSVYTDHKMIMDKIERVKNTPNTYVFFMGNLIDNAIPAQFPDSMLSNAIPPDQQVYMMRQIAMELNAFHKVLGAVTSPCHEGWTWKKAGQDVNAMMFGFKERKFPVLENGGLIHLQVGSTKYEGALYHQVGPFESQFNETHAVRQMNRLNLNMKADFVAAGHKHVGSTQTSYEGSGDQRKLVAYIRTGSEKGTGKLHDIWAVGKYGNTGEPSGQTLELFPDKRMMACETDFDTGMLMHESFYLKAMIKK